MVKTRLFLMILIFCLSAHSSAWSQSLWSLWLQKSEICKNLEDFKLQDISGKEVSLKEVIRKAPVLFVFWTKRCPYCREALRKLIDTSSKIDTSRVVLVNIGERRAEVKTFLSSFNNNPFTVLLDYEGELASDCKVVGIPTFIIINNSGKVEFKGNYLPENYLERLSQGH